MHWEEKIDRLKKQFAPEEFKVPFIVWRAVFRKIEERYIAKEGRGFEAENWFRQMKGGQCIKVLAVSGMEEELYKLDPNQNYWVVLTNEKVEGKRLYDCKPKAIKVLCRLWRGDFFVVDKKYAWLAFFKLAGEDFELHQPGPIDTPFSS